MPSIFDRGTIEPVSAVRGDLLDRIGRRGLKYPGEFREVIANFLDPDPGAKALVLLDDAELAGDLSLDWTPEFEENRVVAVVVRGRLKVDGTIRSEDYDSGPLLFVDGDLAARRLDKRAAPMLVLGDLKLADVGLCEYNHGVLRVGGRLQSPVFLALDHDVLICGETIGRSLSGDDDLRAALVPEVFDPDDPDAVWPDTERLRRRIAAGRPLLKAP